MARLHRPSFSVYKRTSPRWHLLLQWYEGDERHKRAGGTFTTKAEATSAGKDWITDVTRGDVARPSALTVDAWLDDWADLCRVAGLRPRTIFDYEGKLHVHVRPAIGSLPIQDVEPVHLDRIYAAMTEKGRKPRTTRYVHSIVRKSFKDAVAKGILHSNPADRATPPRARAAKAAERIIWTPEQLGVFLDSLDDSPHRTMFHLLAMTGLRRSEACALTWDAIDLDAATLEVRVGLTQTGPELHVHRPKTDRGRRAIDLDPETVALIRVHRRRQLEEKLLVGAGYRDRGFVFARPDGDPWKPDSITAAFRHHIADLPVPTITLHDLRHGHASYMLATSTDVNTVSDRLGHATAGFTLSTYGHSLPGRQAEAVRRVAELVRRGGRTFL